MNDKQLEALECVLYEWDEWNAKKLKITIDSGEGPSEFDSGEYNAIEQCAGAIRQAINAPYIVTDAFLITNRFHGFGIVYPIDDGSEPTDVKAEE